MSWVEQVIAVHRGSGRTAVLDAGGPVTGSELVARAAGAVAWLDGLGCGAGRPVPALVTANATMLALLVGGAASGRPLAPLGPRLTAAELAGPVRWTGSGVLLAEPAFAPVAAEVAAATGVRVVEITGLPSGPATHPLRGGGPGGGPGAVVLHTSGTTGAARPVVLTDEVLVARNALLARLTGIGPGDRYATGSPVHHIGGLGTLVAALSTGATVVPTDRFTVAWWRGLAGLGVTHSLLVPAMIEMLLAEGALDAVGVRTLVYGASPISPTTLGRVLTALPDVELVNLFGQTEGSPITCLTPADHHRAAAGATDLLTSVGRAVPGLALRIDAPDARGVGEVQARAAHLSTPAGDDWLRTGDLGSLDAEGYLRLSGRRHDMVVRGGENIYPVQVEDVIVRHPGVAAAGVVGVPDPRLGETLAAFVVPVDPREPVPEAELASHVRAQLAGFKVPAHWHTVAELPRNAAGKVLRHALRDEHLARMP